MAEGLSMLLTDAPTHPDAPLWQASCEAYADYLSKIRLDEVYMLKCVPVVMISLKQAAASRSSFSGFAKNGR